MKSSYCNLETEICGLKLRNPLLLSSGILDITADLMNHIIKNGAGGVITKGISLKSREGHKNPTVIATKHYILNAMGLCNPGVEEFKKELENVNAPVIANIFGNSYELVTIAKLLEDKVNAFELNVSCPNVQGEKIGQVIGQDPDLVKKITRKVKSAVNIPVFVKLTPNVNDIRDIAKAAKQAGADGISAINTLSGMLINIEAKKPILANCFGGVSGPAIKPIAIASVYKIYEEVDIPIIGVGGLTTGKDVIEMLMAGASAVAIGSAIYYRGINVFQKILNEIQDWMKENKFSSIQELIGIAH